MARTTRGARRVDPRLRLGADLHGPRRQQALDYPGGLPIGTVDPPLDRDHLRTDRSGDYALIGSVLDGKPRTAWVRTRAVSDILSAPAPSPDCTAAVAAERERIATAVLAVIRN